MNTLAQGEKKKKICNIKGDGEGEKVCLRNIDDLITSVGWRGDCMQRGNGEGSVVATGSLWFKRSGYHRNMVPTARWQLLRRRRLQASGRCHLIGR